MATAELTHETGIPADVAAFAAKHDFTQYLAPLEATALTLFPGQPRRWYLEADPDIADQKWLILDVEFANWGPDRALQAHRDWLQSVAAICPAPVGACRVTLRMS